MSYTSLSSYDHDDGDVLLQGFDEVFDPPAPDVYECPICLLVLRLPMQTECGHRFCKGCILKVVREGRPNCPIDNEKLSENQIFPDNFARREILGLSVRCHHAQTNGCTWHSSLRELETHLLNCDFAIVACPNRCDLKIQRVHLKKHMESDCVKRIIECEFCGIKVVFRQKQEHIDRCFLVPVSCPNRCEQRVPREQLKHHMEVECLKLVKSCAYKDAGCNFEGSRTDVEAHEKENIGEHMIDMLKTIKLLRTKVFEQDAIIRKTNEHDGDKMEVETTYSISDVKDSSSSLGSTGSGPSSTVTRFEGKQLKDLEIKVSQLQTVTEMCRSEIKQTKVETNSRFDTIEQKIAEQNNIITEVSARVWCGKFIWRITNFENLFRQAKSGDLPALHSQPFYTGVPGYKMCLRVNLNGIDSGSGTHVSMFVHLMQGEFDNIVSWPFSDGLELTIMDQDQNNPTHVKEELFARPTLQAFLRPKTPRNHKGYGYVEMITHHVLNSRKYLLNDTMVVKVEIKNRTNS